MQTFQELILKLSEFWAERGCVLQQPYDLEVGAGTMHPDTFLRVLGPEPWRVAYVQPSRRPADGRCGCAYCPLKEENDDEDDQQDDRRQGNEQVQADAGALLAAVCDERQLGRS